MIRKLKRYLEQCDMQSVELMVLSLGANVLNYVFQLMLGRMLPISEYGEYNAVNSLISNLQNFFTPLTITACKITAEKIGMRQVNSIKYKQIIKAMCIVAILLLAIGALLYPKLNGAYCSNSLWSWMIVLNTVIVLAVYALMMAIMQGRKMFRLYGWVGLFLILLKIIFSCIAVKIGTGVTGCVFALLLSNFILAVISLIVLKRGDGEDSYNIERGEGFKKLELIRGYGLTFITGIIFSLYISGGEVMLLNHAFDSEQVGLYSAIASLGKISFFVVSIVFVIILPNVSVIKDDGVRLKKTIRKTVALSLVLVLVYASLYQLLGKTIVTISYGEKYANGVYMIKYVNIYVMLISLMGILHNVLIGIDKLKKYTVCTSTIVLITIFIAVGHARSIQMMLTIIIVSLIVIIMNQICIIHKYVERSIEAQDEL